MPGMSDISARSAAVGCWTSSESFRLRSSPYNHRENYVGVLKTWRPQWAVIGYYGHAYRRILDDPWFRSSYVLVHRNTPIVSTGWSIDDPRRDTTYTWEYGIYRLID